jgi:hypothetical protein
MEEYRPPDVSAAFLFLVKIEGSSAGNFCYQAISLKTSGAEVGVGN